MNPLLFNIIYPSIRKSTSLERKSLIKSSACIFCIVGTSLYFSGLHNSSEITVQEGNQISYDVHFINDYEGKLIQEGDVYFLKDLYNNGEINCGHCASGTTHFSAKDERVQHIKSDSLITLYNVELNTSNSLFLKGQLDVVNEFQFQHGRLKTDFNHTNHYLHLRQGATIMNANHDSHINGFVAKTGNDPFIFPLGDGLALKKLGIADMTSISFAKAAYITFLKSQNLDDSQLRISAESVDKHIEKVIINGFWKVESANLMNLTFYWDNLYGFDEELESIDQLSLLGWNGKKWVPISIESMVGNRNKGSVRTGKIIPNDYEAYAFGKIKRKEKA